MRIILCFLLTLVAAPAWAEWVRVAETDASIRYINPDSIRKDGNFRKVWGITDLKQRDKYGEMSRRILEEFDCREERRRYLSISSHSGPMAGGETLEIDGDTTRWSAIPPATVSEVVLKLVCAK